MCATTAMPRYTPHQRHAIDASYAIVAETVLRALNDIDSLVITETNFRGLRAPGARASAAHLLAQATCDGLPDIVWPSAPICQNRQVQKAADRLYRLAAAVAIKAACTIRGEMAAVEAQWPQHAADVRAHTRAVVEQLIAGHVGR